MKQVLVYSILLVAGLFLSQVLPSVFGENFKAINDVVKIALMIGLSFIMIRVGFEFHIDKSRLKSYGWDYAVAFTAAFFPWVLVSGYFIFFMLPSEVWLNLDAVTETLLAGRFAAPTSAGVLFSMLAAAGLGATWVFKKARILAIFDDLDTVLLMIPLQMLIIGLAWQLGIIVGLMFGLLVVAYIWLHRIEIPISWRWVLVYSLVIVGISELIYAGSKLIDSSVPVHIEVLLPAFVLGCVARPRRISTPDEDIISVEHDMHRVLNHRDERKAATIVSAVFMLLVGLNMPAISNTGNPQAITKQTDSASSIAAESSVDQGIVGTVDSNVTASVTASQPNLPWQTILFHVLVVTVLCNVGKMFPAFCYRKEAHWRHRVAVAVGMWPRGEVGAGVLILSISYGIGGPIVTVALISLALNLSLTGLFILFVRRLIAGVPEPRLIN